MLRLLKKAIGNDKEKLKTRKLCTCNENYEMSPSIGQIYDISGCEARCTGWTDCLFSSYGCFTY